jgi:hypothetical protein
MWHEERITKLQKFCFDSVKGRDVDIDWKIIFAMDFRKIMGLIYTGSDWNMDHKGELTQKMRRISGFHKNKDSLD